MDLQKAIADYRVVEEPVFISGIGRSGTHFMATIFDQHEEFHSMHHDEVADPIADVFTWFAKWYELPVSSTGFLRSRGHLIEKLGATGKRYLESNAIICLNLSELVNAFGGKIIIMVRHPKQVAESHFHKGFFEKVDYENALPVPGFNYYHQRPSHFFSRIMPKDAAEFAAWKDYTRMGKCAWKWRICYEEIFRQIEDHKLWENVRFVYLNEFDYDAYKELCSWLRVTKLMDRVGYERIVNNKPGKSKGRPDAYQWTQQDIADYNKEISKVIDKFTMINERPKWLLNE